MASLNPKFSNIIKVFTTKCFNIQKFLSNVGRNVKENCALIANVIISCTHNGVF